LSGYSTIRRAPLMAKEFSLGIALALIAGSALAARGSAMLL
jgi:hypothetical protein